MLQKQQQQHQKHSQNQNLNLNCCWLFACLLACQLDSSGKATRVAQNDDDDDGVLGGS